MRLIEYVDVNDLDDFDLFEVPVRDVINVETLYKSHREMTDGPVCRKEYFRVWYVR